MEPAKGKSDQQVQSLLQPIDTIVSRYERDGSTNVKAPVVRHIPALRASISIANLVKTFCDVSLVRASLTRYGYNDGTVSTIENTLKKSVLEAGLAKLKELATILPTLQLVEAQLRQQVTIKQQMEFAQHQREAEIQAAAHRAAEAAADHGDDAMEEGEESKSDAAWMK